MQVGSWVRLYDNPNPQNGYESGTIGLSEGPLTKYTTFCCMFRDYINPDDETDLDFYREYSLTLRGSQDQLSGTAYTYWGYVEPVVQPPVEEVPKPTPTPDEGEESEDDTTEEEETEQDPNIEYKRSSINPSGSIVSGANVTAQFTNKYQAPFSQNQQPHIVCSDPGWKAILTVGRPCTYRIYYDNHWNDPKKLTLTVKLPDSVDFVSAIMGQLRLDNDGGDKDIDVKDTSDENINIKWTVKDKQVDYNYGTCASKAFGFVELIVIPNSEAIKTKDSEGKYNLKLSASEDLGGNKYSCSRTNQVLGSGDLEISKTVLSDIASARKKDFKFKLTYSHKTYPDTITDRSYDYYIVSDRSRNGGTVFGGEAEFTIRDNERVVIQGLPEGTTYNVEEIIEKKEDKKPEDEGTTTKPTEPDKIEPYDAYSQRTVTITKSTNSAVFTVAYRDKGDKTNEKTVAMVPYQIWAK